ncbi:MAG: GxxExxY protein [Ignavibacteria bacterium]|nr:GxxExxY protein [Ignavibacteria bacterium]
MAELIYKDEFYKIIGICMEVHRTLGRGFLEIIYKDAIEFEFKKNIIPYEREKEYSIPYKEIILPHKYHTDFVVYDKIILEVKAVSGIIEGFTKQTLNYLSASKNKLGIIVNFGEDSLKFQRLVL